MLLSDSDTVFPWFSLKFNEHEGKGFGIFSGITQHIQLHDFR